MFHEHQQEESIRFGAQRLEQRYSKLFSTMVKKKSVILRQLSNSWSEEVAYGGLLARKTVFCACLMLIPLQ